MNDAKNLLLKGGIFETIALFTAYLEVKKRCDQGRNNP